MKQEAIEKLRTEMGANPSHPYFQVVGTYLIGYLEQHEDFAPNILKEGRTIKDSIGAMQEVAKNNKLGNVGVLTDEQGFQVVVDYFAKDLVTPTPAVTPETEAPVAQSPQTESVSPIVTPATGDTPGVFTRNAWYVNEVTGEHFEYNKGDVKPVEVINKVYKVSTKKAYKDFISVSTVAETPQTTEAAWLL